MILAQFRIQHTGSCMFRNTVKKNVIGKTCNFFIISYVEISLKYNFMKRISDDNLLSLIPLKICLAPRHFINSNSMHLKIITFWKSGISRFWILTLEVSTPISNRLHCRQLWNKFVPVPSIQVLLSGLFPQTSLL